MNLLLSPPLFNDDGSMKETTKADLAKNIEAVVTAATAIRGTTAYIIDGMALLQGLHNTGFQTFNNQGESI